MKRISPVTVIGILLTSGCIALYVIGPDFINAVSNRSYDEFIKRTAEPPKSDSVVIVDIDEKSMDRFGQWPWPRYIVAEVTSNLFAEGASVVAFDIVFAERDRLSPLAIKQNIASNFHVDVNFEGLPSELSDYDNLFTDVLDGKAAVLGCMMQSCDEAVEYIDIEKKDPFYARHFIPKGSGGDWARHLFQAEGVILPIPVLNKSSHTAFFNAVPEEDGVIRSNPLVWNFGGNVYPSLALECVRLHLGESQYIIEYNQQGIAQIRMRRINPIPTDSQARLAINYRQMSRDRESTPFCFRTFSAVDVYDLNFKQGAFTDKIVLVGTSAAGLKDIRATPLSQYFPGVEIHATMVDNILVGDMFSNPIWMVGANVMTIAMMGIFLTVFINRGRSWLSFLVSIAMILLAVNASMYLIDRYNIVFIPSWLIMSVIIIYPVLTMIKFWQEEQQKKRVRNMFGTMVSSDVLHYLENNPGSFSLSGHKTEATMFFSDVAGFTSISESLPPERLSELLNRYLSPMTRIIMDRRGYVDKYEGDLIMAEWGVPYPVENHAVQACMAALEQQKKLKELRPLLAEEFGYEIYVRMGLNSGDVTAGNMGSDKRFQYTVMGDAVNQAARFEPANKEYGTSIIIGESTYQQAKDSIEARLLDRALVKGKIKPITIYELLAEKDELSDKLRQLVEYYEFAVMAHWERKWDHAIDLLEKALELDPTDQPSVNMLKRIEGYKKVAPEDGWMGEYATIAAH